MHGLDLITTLTGGLLCALVLGYGSQRLGLSPLVGYLLAGVVVGPHTPGFEANKDLADQLAEVGVILLMFGVGLHFHLRELLAVRHVAIPGALGQILVATTLGCLLFVGFGLGWSAGIVFGLAISVASTVVLLRVLADNNDLHTPTGHIAVGWLIVEDLFTVLVLVLLPAVSENPASGERTFLPALGIALLKIAFLIAFVFQVGGRFLPWILGRVAATRSRELFTLTVLVMALGIAVGAAKVFGVSMALGAFLAGMIVARSDFSSRAASEALPMRDAFAVLFFVSVGMLFDPRHLLEAPGLVAATLAVVLVCKPLAALGIVLFLGYPLRVGLSVAVALSQIGEFSFILIAQGEDLGLLPESATNAVVAAALVSIGLNPILYRMVDVVDAKARRSSRRWRWLSIRAGTRAAAEDDARAAPAAAKNRAIVIGHGPVGQTLVRLLRENEIEPTVIELNLETVLRLRRQGVRAVYGDAAHEATLREAGVEHAVALIISSSVVSGGERVIQVARDANRDIRLIARATYLRELPALRRAGADVVFTGEGEVALSMTEILLRQLGATSEQIDRESERIRTELFGGPFAVEPMRLRTPHAPVAAGEDEHAPHDAPRA